MIRTSLVDGPVGPVGPVGVEGAGAGVAGTGEGDVGGSSSPHPALSRETISKAIWRRIFSKVTRQYQAACTQLIPDATLSSLTCRRVTASGRERISG